MAHGVALTPQKLASSGLTPSQGAVDSGLQHNFPPASGRFVWVHNGSGGSITVTLRSHDVEAGLTLPDRAITVAAGADVFIGEIEGIFTQADETIWIDFSAASSVTVGIYDTA